MSCDEAAALRNAAIFAFALCDVVLLERMRRRRLAELRVIEQRRRDMDALHNWLETGDDTPRQ